MDEAIDKPMDDLMDEQIRYYRERAPEYDATSRPPGDQFAALNDEAVAALRAMGLVAQAIELGAGTGAFTGVVAGIADRVLAVDSSPEMLELNRAKVGAPNVQYVTADVFEWDPLARAELVVSAFLLSHIPSERFAAFWGSVGRMLEPGGRVFVMDETAHGLWREESFTEAGGEVVTRTLSDGRSFRMVKVLWEPDQLAQRLAELGWNAQLVRRDPFFWGVVAPHSLPSTDDEGSGLAA